MSFGDMSVDSVTRGEYEEVNAGPPEPPATGDDDTAAVCRIDVEVGTN